MEVIMLVMMAVVVQVMLIRIARAWGIGAFSLMAVLDTKICVCVEIVEVFSNELGAVLTQGSECTERQ